MAPNISSETTVKAYAIKDSDNLSLPFTLHMLEEECLKLSEKCKRCYCIEDGLGFCANTVRSCWPNRINRKR